MEHSEDVAYKHLKEAVEHFGYLPSVPDYDKWARNNKKLSYHLIRKYTGKTWAELSRKLDVGTSIQRQREFIIFHLKEAANIFGENFTKRQYAEYAKDGEEKPKLHDIINTFSTFNKAKLAAGFIPNQGVPVSEISDETCLSALSDCAKVYGNNFTEDDYRSFVKEQRDQGKGYPSSRTIRARFGSFSNGLKKADLKMHAELTEADVLQSAVNFLSDTVTARKYDEWAKENGHMTWEQFSKRGFEFRETMLKALKGYLSRRK